MIQLVKKSPRLKSVKLAWCGRLTSESVKYVVENCLGIEELVVTGVKQLFDTAFQEIKALMPMFNREKYLDIKHSDVSVAGLDPGTLFSKPHVLDSVKCLRNLCLLDCVSCDAVSN